MTTTSRQDYGFKQEQKWCNFSFIFSFQTSKLQFIIFVCIGCRVFTSKERFREGGETLPGWKGMRTVPNTHLNQSFYTLFFNGFMLNPVVSFNPIKAIKVWAQKYDLVVLFVSKFG